MELVRKLALGGVLALSMVFPAMAAEKAIIVLDASGSMWAQVDGKARITIARETLASVLNEVPADLELGFMAYGHREKGNCDDIELIVAPGPGTGPAIVAAADDITPKGKTPLSAAVRLAAEELKYTEEKATVILITDGLETCEVDPCALGNELEAQGVDFTAHVLGFGLTEDEGKQVACLAENTGGQYFSAADGAALVEALTTTVNATVEEPEPEPEPEPTPVVAEFNLEPTASLAEGGANLVDDVADLVWVWSTLGADGTAGEYLGTDYYSKFKIKLEPGEYFLTATLGFATSGQKVTITADAVAKPHFVLNGSVLLVHPRSSDGATVDSDAPVNVVWPDGQTTFYGDTKTVVPAGEITLNVSIGAAKYTEIFTAKAGETIDKDVVVGSGVANLKAEYIAGQPAAVDVFMEIFEAKTDINGNRKSVANGYGGDQNFELAPGDYVVVFSFEAVKGEAPFSVKVAERTDLTVIMGAGVLAVTMADSQGVEIVSPKKDINGNRASVAYGYGPDFHTTLKAGDYVVLAHDKEFPITITGGERTEIKVK